MLSCAVLAAVDGIGSDVVRAQAQQGRSFEVASVRLAPKRPTNPSRSYTDSRVDLTDISLRILLLRAFRLEQPSRLLAPEWASDVNLDVHATIPEGSSREHVPEMLQTLLITRFGLRAHAEPRPTNVYELVAAGSGLRIQQVQELNELDRAFPSDPAGLPLLGDQTRETMDGRLRLLSTSRGQIFVTERSKYERIRKNRGTEEIDRTGLTGLYDFTLKFTYEGRMPGLMGPLGVPAGTPAPAADPDAPSLSAALQEQLGLKLESARGPVEVVVIEKFEKPTLD